MKNFTLLVATTLLSSSVALAQSTTIKDAFVNGSTNGSITLFYQGQYNSGNTPDSGSLVGLASLNYSTDSFHGFTLNTGFLANHKFYEDENGDYTGAYQNKALMNVANITYANDSFFASIGRQELGLEWLNYFYEAAVVGVTAIPHTTIIAGYVDRKTELAYDVIEDFHEVTKDGAYVLDIKTSVGIEGLEVNPYFITAPDALDMYGLKVSYDNNIFGATAHFADIGADNTIVLGDGTELNGAGLDGDILHLEARVNMVENLGLALGYISTGEAGVDLVTGYGDSLSPFEDGNNVYGFKADTWYLSAGYDFNFGLGLGLVYGQTDYKDGNTDADDKELNIGASYSFSDELSAEILYVNYSGNTSDEDYDKILAGITYSF